MRKIIILTCLCLYTIVSIAQLTSNANKTYTNFSGIDYVFIFNGITSFSDITYTGTGTTINWYKFSDSNTSISSFSTIFPEDGTGYTLVVDGIKTNIWVIDYNNYLPVSNTTFEPDNSISQCSIVSLNINPAIPLLIYKTPDNVSHIIPRNCNINYKTLKWDGTAWQPRDTTMAVTLPANQLSVPVPYTNTTFTLSGDQFATDLNINPFSISSAQFSTSAVICHPTTVVTSRSHLKNNEADAPSDATPINFSAPIDVQFLSNANEPVTQYYNWGIYKDNKLIIKRTDKDHRYTFTDAGTYNIKLSVSNLTCSFSDSLTVIVSESALYVPDVFTPNGDGFNDEFRVAYKSLISFQCWVYNRWGRQVYYWNDPTKGWDGNINGKKAVPGPYFYVIKALGSDKKVYKLSGDINLLRGTTGN
jgi:gliding motility-associated-like protein